MQLANILKPAIGAPFETIRSTYTNRTAKEIDHIAISIMDELAEAIDDHIREQFYPRHSGEAFKPSVLVRLPEHIRGMIIDRVDERFNADELAMKMEMYLMLTMAVGNKVTDGYTERYQKVLDKLRRTEGPLPNPKNN